jgi:hypothetical protein
MGWSTRLDDYLDTFDGKVFDWAEIYCGLFAADAIVAMIGIDLATEFRGKVNDAASAAEALKRAGYVTVADVAADRLVECPVSSLRRGDIACVELSTGPTLYIVSGASLIGLGQRGKVTLPLTKANLGYHVG